MCRDPGKCDIDVPRKKVEAVATFSVDLGIIRNVQQRLYCSLARSGQLVRFAVFRNVTLCRNPCKCDIETPRKKVKAAVTCSNDLGIIRNVQQRLYCSLAIRKDRDAGERNNVSEDPLSVLQFSGMSQCAGTQVSVTLKRPERRLRQRRHTLTILELFATLNRDFIAVWLSEKIVMGVKATTYARIH